jgi:hypothetical protein
LRGQAGQVEGTPFDDPPPHPDAVCAGEQLAQRSDVVGVLVSEEEEVHAGRRRWVVVAGPPRDCTVDPDQSLPNHLPVVVAGGVKQERRPIGCDHAGTFAARPEAGPELEDCQLPRMWLQGAEEGRGRAAAVVPAAGFAGITGFAGEGRRPTVGG